MYENVSLNKLLILRPKKKSIRHGIRIHQKRIRIHIRIRPPKMSNIRIRPPKMSNIRIRPPKMSNIRISSPKKTWRLRPLDYL